MTGARRRSSRALGARVYAQGDAVAFASSPDLHTAAQWTSDRVILGLAILVESDNANSKPLLIQFEVDRTGTARCSNIGHFVLAGPHGRFRVHASKGPLASGSEEVDLPPKKHVEVRLVVARSSITGIVVDPRGRPVSGARVSASSSVNLGSYETHVATSDAKGRFEVTGVVPGDYSLSAERPDDEVGDTTHVVKAKSGESGVRLVLPEAVSVDVVGTCPSGRQTRSVLRRLHHRTRTTMAGLPARGSIERGTIREARRSCRDVERHIGWPWIRPQDAQERIDRRWSRPRSRRCHLRPRTARCRARARCQRRTDARSERDGPHESIVV